MKVCCHFQRPCPDFSAVNWLKVFQHEITELDDEHDVASDVTEEQDEKGETTDIKDELEYFVNGNESVDHNQNLFNCKQQDEKNVSR